MLMIICKPIKEIQEAKCKIKLNIINASKLTIKITKTRHIQRCITNNLRLVHKLNANLFKVIINTKIKAVILVALAITLSAKILIQIVAIKAKTTPNQIQATRPVKTVSAKADHIPRLSLDLSLSTISGLIKRKLRASGSLVAKFSQKQ